MHLYGIPETSRHQVQALDFRVNIWTRILQTGSRGARWTHKLLMVLSINHPPSGLGHHFEHNPPVILVVFWGLLHPTKKLKKWLLFMCFSMNNIDETNWPTMGPDSKQKTPDFFCYQKNLSSLGIGYPFQTWCILIMFAFDLSIEVYRYTPICGQTQISLFAAEIPEIWNWCPICFCAGWVYFLWPPIRVF